MQTRMRMSADAYAYAYAYECRRNGNDGNDDNDGGTPSGIRPTRAFTKKLLPLFLILLLMVGGSFGDTDGGTDASHACLRRLHRSVRESVNA